MIRQRLQEQIQKKKKVEKLDVQRKKLEEECTPGTLLAYMENLEKYASRQLVKPLLQASPLHGPLLDCLDDFKKFETKYNELTKKKQKKPVSEKKNAKTWYHYFPDLHREWRWEWKKTRDQTRDQNRDQSGWKRGRRKEEEEKKKKAKSGDKQTDDKTSDKANSGGDKGGEKKEENTLTAKSGDKTDKSGDKKDEEKQKGKGKGKGANQP